MKIEVDLEYETKGFRIIKLIADVDVEISSCNSDAGISDGTITDMDVPVFYYNETGDRCSKYIQRYLEKYFNEDDRLSDAIYERLELYGGAA